MKAVNRHLSEYTVQSEAVDCLKLLKGLCMTRVSDRLSVSSFSRRHAASLNKSCLVQLCELPTLSNGWFAGIEMSWTGNKQSLSQWWWLMNFRQNKSTVSVCLIVNWYIVCCGRLCNIWLMSCTRWVLPRCLWNVWSTGETTGPTAACRYYVSSLHRYT